jgi:hypothetical protein
MCLLTTFTKFKSLYKWTSSFWNPIQRETLHVK